MIRQKRELHLQGFSKRFSAVCRGLPLTPTPQLNKTIHLIELNEETFSHKLVEYFPLPSLAFLVEEGEEEMN